MSVLNHLDFLEIRPEWFRNGICAVHTLFFVRGSRFNIFYCILLVLDRDACDDVLRHYPSFPVKELMERTYCCGADRCALGIGLQDTIFT